MRFNPRPRSHSDPIKDVSRPDIARLTRLRLPPAALRLRTAPCMHRGARVRVTMAPSLRTGPHPLVPLRCEAAEGPQSYQRVHARVWTLGRHVRARIIGPPPAPQLRACDCHFQILLRPGMPACMPAWRCCLLPIVTTRCSAAGTRTFPSTVLGPRRQLRPGSARAPRTWHAPPASAVCRILSFLELSFRSRSLADTC